MRDREVCGAAVIVSNHVSYLDILVHMSHSAPSFVARGNTQDLPLIGVVRCDPHHALWQHYFPCILCQLLYSSLPIRAACTVGPSVHCSSLIQVREGCTAVHMSPAVKRSLCSPSASTFGSCSALAATFAQCRAGTWVTGHVHAQQTPAVHLREPGLQNKERRGCGACLQRAPRVFGDAGVMT